MSISAHYKPKARRHCLYPDKPVHIIVTNGGGLLTLSEAIKLRDQLARVIDIAEVAKILEET